jgi:predicted thioesterase
MIVVGPENRISFADTRMPAVLATPWLIAHLEYAARDALARCLEDHERSVGTFVEVEHLAPTPEGCTVTCRARVIHVNGPVAGSSDLELAPRTPAGQSQAHLE